MKLLRKVRSLFHRGKLDAEMRDEMRAHVELQTERNIAAGMDADEARYSAMRRFGNMASLQERARDGRRILWLENLYRDATFAVRTLRKSPGSSSVIVFTLALGLGVNMAVFTWFNAVAFRPLPVRDPGQLFTLARMDANGGETSAMSYTDFETYREHQTVLSGLVASAGVHVQPVDADEFAAPAGEEPAGFPVEAVSTNYFDVIGVPMALGRPLLASDETSTRAFPVIVLNHRFWQNHLGGDPAVIGRKLRLRGLAEESLTIVGVTGPEFFGTRPGALAGWVPLFMRPGDGWRSDLKATNFTLAGRLRPGISPEQAAEELRVIANEFLARPRVGHGAAETIILNPASTYLNLTAKHISLLLPLTCMFGAVFLISCANASNLILARAVTRQFEFAVRAAYGASRRRLFSLIITESVLLGVLGGLAGWAVAAALLRFAWPWLVNMVPDAREGVAGLHLHADHRVFLFTLIVSMIAGVSGGLLPALHVMRRSVVSALKQQGSAFGRGLSVSRVRNILAVAQIALSSALIYTAGLLAHRAVLTQFADVGFDKSRLLTLEVRAPRTYESHMLDSARKQVIERIRALPDVVAVSEMPRFPFAPSRATVTVPAGDSADSRPVYVLHAAVPANYFDTLQLPLTRGRAFAASEIASDRIAVINETAAREFFPEGNPLGRSFNVPSAILPDSGESAAKSVDGANAPHATLTVVGVVRDTRLYDPWSGDRPMVFLPLAQQTSTAPYLLIRTGSEAAGSVATLQQLGREVTGIVPRTLTVDDLFASAAVQFRVIAWGAGILAALSLIVAVIGLYGVMSFAVTQRGKEIGIRVAMGATPGHVVSGIVRESMRLVGVGAALGFGLSVMASSVARTFLFEVDAFDPLAGAIVALLLSAVAILACWEPARRAARVDPMVALRAE
jgi:predicted permease